MDRIIKLRSKKGNPTIRTYTMDTLHLQDLLSNSLTNSSLLAIPSISHANTTCILKEDKLVQNELAQKVSNFLHNF